MAITRKTITISIKEDSWKILKDRKIRVSTLINDLIDKYLEEQNV